MSHAACQGRTLHLRTIQDQVDQVLRRLLVLGIFAFIQVNTTVLRSLYYGQWRYLVKAPDEDPQVFVRKSVHERRRDRMRRAVPAEVFHGGILELENFWFGRRVRRRLWYRIIRHGSTYSIGFGHCRCHGQRRVWRFLLEGIWTGGLWMWM